MRVSMVEGSEFIKDLLPTKMQSGLEVKSSRTFCVQKICASACKEESQERDSIKQVAEEKETPTRHFNSLREP